VPALFDPFINPQHIQRTERSKCIAKLHAIYDGKQYDGQADWWTGCKPGTREVVPLRERKPCVIYRLPQAAVCQVVRFLFGDGRFPSILVKATVEEDEPEEQEEPEPTLPGLPPPKPRKPPKKNPILDRMQGGIEVTEDEAEALQVWLSDFIEASQVKPLARAAAKLGIACKTSVSVLGFRDGDFHVENPLAEHCYAQFRNDDPLDEVLRLVQCYEFDAEVAREDDGRPEKKRFIFRREWDDKACHTWEPVLVEPNKPLKWGAVESVPHGFSFCPVLWLPNATDNSGGIDGVSLFEDSADEIHALDFTLSQRHRGLTYYGSPQMVETGVEPGDGPGATGRTAIEVSPDGYRPAVEPARKMGGNQIWTYERAEAEVKLVETSGKAFEVASKHVVDIRSRLLETWGVVLTSMTDTMDASRGIGQQMSARFLALAHAPLIGTVSELRHIWWPYYLKRLLSMAMRMVVDLGGKGILIPGTEEIAGILSRFYVQSEATGQREWVCPRMDPAWGDFFEPSSAEIKEQVEAAGKAHETKLICHETAVTSVAHAFDIEDVTSELDEIEHEAAESANREMVTEAAAVSAVHGMVNDRAAGTAGASRNAPPTAGGNRGPAAAAKTGGQAEPGDG
jgi:hypothetical protein